MVDKEAILANFRKFFIDDSLVAGDKVDIDERGRLNVLGNVVLKPRWTTLQSTGLPYGVLPVKFGTVSGSFDIRNANLQSLEGCATSVGNICSIGGNPIATLKGAPEHVHYMFAMDNLPELQSLEGFPAELNICKFDWRKDLPLLRVLQAKALRLSYQFSDASYESPPKLCLSILRKYVGQGRRVIHLCAKELVANGLEGNARW